MTNLDALLRPIPMPGECADLGHTWGSFVVRTQLGGAEWPFPGFLPSSPRLSITGQHACQAHT